VTALLQAELLKLRTTRTFLAMASAALALSLLTAVLNASLDDGADARDLLDNNGASLFILLLGAVGITGEWRHRTITSSLLAAPDRVRFVAAKVLAYAAAGVVLSLVVTGTVALVTTGILSSRDLSIAEHGDVVDAAWRNALLSALGGGLGVAFGSIVRNQASALVALIVLALMVEPLVITLEPDVGRYLPVSGAPNAINRVGDDDELLNPAAGAVVELGWIAGLAAIGALLLRRRDL
jgi:ABC-2 type transport system permease protein